MKRIFALILIVSIGTFLACDDLNEPILLKEFQVGFQASTSDASIDVRSTEDVTHQIPIMLIGEQRNEAVTVTVRIDPDLTTALPGTMYELVNETITIPANSSFGNVELLVKRDGFVQPGERYEVVLQIIETSAKIALNFDLHTATLETILPYDINDFVGTYSVVDVDTDGGSASYQLATELVDGKENTILVTGLWDGGPAVEMVLDPSSNTLEIPIQTFGCYNAGTEADPLCTILTSQASRQTPVTGTFKNGGGPINLTSGYTVNITTPPYETYYLTPSVISSVWTKTAAKKSVKAQPVIREITSANL